MTKPKILGIIPARFGSKRLPGKMLADIGGRPLIEHTYLNAILCKELDALVVATDHREIYERIRNLGGRAVMTSESCPTGSDRLAEALNNDESLNGYEIVVNIQGDEPRIAPETIGAVAKAIAESPEAAVSTAVVPIASMEEAAKPSVVKCVCDQEGYALYFSRAPIPYNRDRPEESSCYKHLGIYGFKREFLLLYPRLPATPLQMLEDLEQLKILEHGYKIKVILASGDSLGVDTYQDLENLRKL